jgi:hypothetical protein
MHEFAQVERLMDLPVEDIEIIKAFDEYGNHIGYILMGSYFLDIKEAESTYTVRCIKYNFCISPDDEISLGQAYIDLYDSPTRMTFLDIIRVVCERTAYMKANFPNAFYRDPCDAVWHTTTTQSGIVTFDNDT